MIRGVGPQRFAVPEGMKLAPGTTLTTRSGTGEGTASTLSWSTASHVWNSPGGTARLDNAKGTLLGTRTYKGGVEKATTTARSLSGPWCGTR